MFGPNLQTYPKAQTNPETFLTTLTKIRIKTIWLTHQTKKKKQKNPTKTKIFRKIKTKKKDPKTSTTICQDRECLPI